MQHKVGIVAGKLKIWKGSGHHYFGAGCPLLALSMSIRGLLGAASTEVALQK